MEMICDDLWETPAEGAPGGPTTHAYLWLPPGGENILFYNVGTSIPLPHLDRLGGFAHQYLSHQDEVTPMLATFRDRFGTRLHVSAREADRVEAVRPVDVAFDARHVDANGVEVIPTPGHTSGSACFLVDGAAGRYLFTGDTLLQDASGSWFAGYIPGYSDRERLLQSLDLLATLRPDWVISSAFVAGGRGAHRLDRPWADCVAEAAEALREQASGGRSTG
jgi:hydroxyacylglutathione hydrolase